MKRYHHIIALSFLLVSLFSCNSSYVMTIETQKPAAITLPLQVDGIVVVNNAIPQPSDMGIELKVNKVDTDKGQRLEMDTTLWYAVLILTETIRDTKCFDKTLMNNVALRKDAEWLVINEIPKEVCDSIYDETGCNMIVSADRLVFKIQQAVLNTGSEGYFKYSDNVLLYVKGKATFTCSIYLAGKDKKVTTFSVQDSIVLNTSIVYDSLNVYREVPNLIVRELAQIVAEKTASYFFPNWETTDRLIYSSVNSRMKEADRYFKNHKWSNARLIWEQLYEKENNVQNKGRLLMNIATAYEMEDQLDKAVEWAKRSKEFYDRISLGKAEEEKKANDDYIAVLLKRINDNGLLDIQFKGKNN